MCFASNSIQGPSADKAFSVIFVLWLAGGLFVAARVLLKLSNSERFRWGLVGRLALAAMAGSAVLAPVVLFDLVLGA